MIAKLIGKQINLIVSIEVSSEPKDDDSIVPAALTISRLPTIQKNIESTDGIWDSNRISEEIVDRLRNKHLRKDHSFWTLINI